MHIASSPPIFFFLAKLLAGGLFGVIVFVLYTSVSVIVVRVIHGGKTLRESVVEDTAAEHSAHLIVDPAWALVAVCLDALLIVINNAILWRFLQHPGSMLPTSHTVLAADAVAARLMFGFVGYVHYRATHPGKRKRVLVPAKNGA